MAHLSAQFKAKTSEREYVALVWGNVDLEEGTIEGNIGRHPKNRLQNTVYFGDEADKGKPAVTHYKVLTTFGLCHSVGMPIGNGTYPPNTGAYETHWAHAF